MVAHRGAGHDYLVQLVCGLDIEDADDPSLAGDLIERGDLARLYRPEGSLGLLLPELVKREVLWVHLYVHENQHFLSSPSSTLPLAPRP
jgi:hypothetical protein